MVLKAIKMKKKLQQQWQKPQQHIGGYTLGPQAGLEAGDWEGTCRRHALPAASLNCHSHLTNMASSHQQLLNGQCGLHHKHDPYENAVGRLRCKPSMEEDVFVRSRPIDLNLGQLCPVAFSHAQLYLASTRQRYGPLHVQSSSSSPSGNPCDVKDHRGYVGNMRLIDWINKNTTLRTFCEGKFKCKLLIWMAPTPTYCRRCFYDTHITLTVIIILLFEHYCRLFMRNMPAQ